jgi:hypothetical protein
MRAINYNFVREYRGRVDQRGRNSRQYWLRPVADARDGTITTRLSTFRMPIGDLLLAHARASRSSRGVAPYAGGYRALEAGGNLRIAVADLLSLAWA